MEKLKIQTTQNVYIEYESASVGERLLALLVDLAVMLAYLFIMEYILTNLILSLPFLSFEDLEKKIEITYILQFALLIIPISTYSLLQETFFNGQTIGKRVLRIKVISMDGKQPHIGHYAIRWVFRLIDVWATLGLAAIISASVTKKGQRLGDLAAGTCLMKMQSHTQLSSPMMIPKLDKIYVPQYNHVTLLSDNDINLIKEFLIHYKKTGQHTVLREVALKTKEILGVQSKESDSQFLRTVVKDYTYLTSGEN